MKSAEFQHGPYVIKTFAIHGEVRGRVFLDGVWMRDVPDCVTDTLDETLGHLRRVIDLWQEEMLEETPQPCGGAMPGPAFAQQVPAHHAMG